MNNVTMQNMLISLGIPQNTWVSNKDIFMISLTSNGNFYNDYFGTRINFNTTNELLRVKNYKFKLASGEFDKIEQVAADTLKATADINSQYAKYTKLNETIPRLRNPKVGDIVYTVNSSNVIVATALITEILGGTITLDANLTIGSNRVAFADGSLIEVVGGNLQTKAVGSFLEEYPDFTTMIYREQTTTNITDEYIDFGKINGFSLNRYKV